MDTVTRTATDAFWISRIWIRKFRTRSQRQTTDSNMSRANCVVTYGELVLMLRGWLHVVVSRHVHQRKLPSHYLKQGQRSVTILMVASRGGGGGRGGVGWGGEGWVGSWVGVEGYGAGQMLVGSDSEI